LGEAIKRIVMEVLAASQAVINLCYLAKGVVLIISMMNNLFINYTWGELCICLKRSFGQFA